MSKKMTIWTFIIFAIFAAWVIRELTDNRPVKFEKYKTSKELKAFLDKQYPIGSDAEKAFNDLKKSGADCEDLSNKNRAHSLLKYDYVGWCEYRDSFFSCPPLMKNRVAIIGNKEKEILKHSVAKYNFTPFNF
jgi:hypothetical protein